MALGQLFLKEIEAEAPASRKCVERMRADLFDWKPHPKSMQMGYLAQMTAEIPKWITAAVEQPDINFATWERVSIKTPEEYVAYLDKNMAAARKALSNVSDAALDAPFYLKSGEQVLMTSTKKDMISSTIHHWVHHRGQLTVYMRLNNIPVPAIYGPSADDKTF